MVDKSKIEEAVKLLLEGIGEDVDREGLRETPVRIARMYEEIFGGMDEAFTVILIFPVGINKFHYFHRCCLSLLRLPAKLISYSLW